MAAKATLLQAMKVMYEDKQEGLLEKNATKDKQGRPRVKNVSKGGPQNAFSEKVGHLAQLADPPTPSS